MVRPLTSRWLISCALVVLLLPSCSSSSDEATEMSSDDEVGATTLIPTTTAAATTTAAPTTTGASIGQDSDIAVDEGQVYLSDDEGDWTLDVFYPDREGPWPLIVVIPPQQSVDYAAREMARRGAVVVAPDSWTTEGWIDPARHLYGEMDRAACAVGWAQAHAADYGANADATTVDGYSGGAIAAAWVGLGLADDSPCPNPISTLPTGLVVGESQALFHHERWDASFMSGDAEPNATLDGLFNSQHWNVSPQLRVALWSAEHPLSETRAVENPPTDDSWVWLREDATPIVDDLIAVGAFDDERVDWSDNALLMELRMQQAGVDVQNAVFSIGHRYDDEVYDLIFSIQP